MTIDYVEIIKADAMHKQNTHFWTPCVSNPFEEILGVDIIIIMIMWKMVG